MAGDTCSLIIALRCVLCALLATTSYQLDEYGGVF